MQNKLARQSSFTTLGMALGNNFHMKYMCVGFLVRDDGDRSDVSCKVVKVSPEVDVVVENRLGTIINLTIGGKIDGFRVVETIWCFGRRVYTIAIKGGCVVKVPFQGFTFNWSL
jgi:hypothetical protein